MRKWLAPVFILITIRGPAIVFPRLPLRIPVHWGPNGQVDRYGGRVAGVALLPLVMPDSWLLLRFLPRSYVDGCCGAVSESPSA